MSSDIETTYELPDMPSKPEPEPTPPAPEPPPAPAEPQEDPPIQPQPPAAAPPPTEPPAPEAAPASPAPPARALTFSGLIKRGLAIFGQVWWKLILFQVITIAALAANGFLLTKFVGVATVMAIPAYMFQVFVSIWMTTASAHLVAGAESGIGMREAAGRGLRHFLPFVWISILSGLVVAGGNLLVIPGIMWSVTFILLIWVLVVEDVRGMGALVRTRQWVRGDGVGVFFRTLFFLLLVAIPGFVLTIIANAIAPAQDMESGIPGIVSTVYGALVLGPLFLAFNYAMFEDLQRRKAASLPELPRQKTYFIIAAVAAPLVIAAIVFSTIGMFVALISGGGPLADMKEMNDTTELQRMLETQDDMPTNAAADEDEKTEPEEVAETAEPVGPCGGAESLTADDLKKALDGMGSGTAMSHVFDPESPGDDDSCSFDVGDSLDILRDLAYLKWLLLNYQGIIGTYPANMTDLPPDSTEGGIVAALEGFEYEARPNLTGYEMSAYLYPIDSDEPVAVTVVSDPSTAEMHWNDGDEDGLSDTDEAFVFDTSATKADSDGDGYSDGMEIAGGFHPLVDGAQLGPNDLAMIYVKILRNGFHTSLDSDVAEALFVKP